MGYFDSLADKMKDMKPPIQRRYNEVGVHILGILETKMVKSTRFGKSDTFVAEFVTLQSTSPAQEAGAKTAWAPSMSWDGTPRDIRGFIAAVGKRRFEEITTAHMSAIVDFKRDQSGNLVDGQGVIPLDLNGNPTRTPLLLNPLRGKLVKVRVTTKDRSDKGKGEWTQHDWYPVPADVEPVLLKKFEEMLKPT